MSDALLFGINPATGEQIEPGFAEASDADVANAAWKIVGFLGQLPLDEPS